MANFKKGIALALVATTAFTFAPVANLGTPVVAEAAATYADPGVATTQDNFSNINLTEGKRAAYRVNVPNVDTDFTYNVSTSNVNVAALQIANNVDTTPVPNKDNVENGTAFYVAAREGKAGESATIKVEYTVNGNKVVKSFVVTVVAKSNTPGWSLTHDNAKDGVFTDQKLSTDNDRILTAGDAANGDKFDILKATSDKTDVIEVKNQATVNVTDNNWDNYTDTGVELTFKKKGTATLTIEANVKHAEDVKKKTYKLTFNVIPAGSTMKIGDVEVAGDAQANAPVKTIVLSGTKLSDSIGAVLEDPQSKNEKLVYSVYRVDKDGKPLDLQTSQPLDPPERGEETAATIDKVAKKTKDIVLDGDKVTATANALNASEQYYNVLVSNNKTSDADEFESKSTWVRLVTIRNQKAFTNVEVKVENAKDALKAEASYDKDGSVLDKLDVEGNVTLSTKDLTSLAVTSTSNVAASNFTIKSNDPSTVAVEDGKLVAKKVGVAAVTFKAISDADHYGNAQVTLNVNVTDQAVANKIKGADVALTATARKATIQASSDYPTTFSYKLVKKNSDGTYTGTSNDSLKLDEKTGEIEYVGDEKGTAYVQISGVATTESRTPIAAVVTVTYTSEKAASKLAVVTKSVNVEAGKTAAIVATGTALTYTSSDETVATVAADGTVTAVKAGVAVITVTDAGDANTEGGSVDVPVYVTAKAAPVVIAKPAKVTGLKVANVKGAKVKVSFKKSAKATGYLVTYKVGKKTVKKTTTKTALTLSVKKGAKVKVSVKAFNKNAAGAKQYSAAVSKSLKTDKK